MLTRKTKTEIINIITKHVTQHLTAIYAFTSKKQGITGLVKNSNHRKTSDNQIINKKTVIVDTIKEKVNKKLALATKVAVPAPQRYSVGIEQPLSTSNSRSSSANKKEISTVRQMYPTCTTKQYKLLIKNLDKEESRRQMIFFWQLIKKKDRQDFNKEEKALHEIAQRKYIDTIKEEIKRLNIQNSQPYEVDFRRLRAKHFIEEYVEGLSKVITEGMKERRVNSKQFLFITHNGNTDGMLQPNFSSPRQLQMQWRLQMWCFERRYLGEIDYQRVNDRIKNQSGYLITFKVQSGSRG